MHADPRTMLTALTSLAVVATLAGCATSGGRVTSGHGGEERLPTPPVVLVDEFGISAEDVVVDTFGSEYDRGSASTSKEYQRARQVAAVLQEKLIAELRARRGRC